MHKWTQSFKEITQYLIKAKAIDRVGSQMRFVDVVRDVINLVPVYWISNETVRSEFLICPFPSLLP